MSQPPYHLRPNKAVDRLVFVDGIRRLQRLGNLSDYTYYSLGGPYLEDFRLVYEYFPELSMVSIERDEEIFKRQHFHLPCGNLTLRNLDFASFLVGYQPGDARSIFWLDNIGLEYSHFDEFMTVLQRVSAGSMVKVTLDASTKKFTGKKDEVERRSADFRAKFRLVLPDPACGLPIDVRGFAGLLQQMVRVAAERALPGNVPMMFQPVSSFYYVDGAAMLTVTGVVCTRSSTAEVVKAFGDWPLANVNWSEPKKIDLPVLTTKERLHLQRHLPAGPGAGRKLREVLGYLTESEDERRTEEQLAQYAEYHRYSPYFIRGIP